MLFPIIKTVKLNENETNFELHMLNRILILSIVLQKNALLVLYPGQKTKLLLTKINAFYVTNVLKLPKLLKNIKTSKLKCFEIDLKVQKARYLRFGTESWGEC